MKNETIFRIIFLVVLAFLTVSSYLWYLYFHRYEEEVLIKETIPDLEITNSGKTDYVNAKVGDSKEVIPVYYFRIKNNKEESISYKILIHDVLASEAKDGCTASTSFTRDELRYELTLKGKVVAKGLLSSLVDDTLSLGTVAGKSLNDYAIRVYLSNTNIDVNNALNKHYHYTIEVKVI